MIKEIKIENFKSIQSLNLELGRLNVFIGANGSGKSNILEAIAMGSAAINEKLDGEFLYSRGVRRTDIKHVKSGFEEVSASKPIFIDLQFDDKDYSFPMQLDYDAKLSKLEIINGGFAHNLDSFLKEIGVLIEKGLFKENDSANEALDYLRRKKLAQLNIGDFIIFAPENTFLRQFEGETQIKPLGTRGEGLFSELVKIMEKKDGQLDKINEYLELLDWFAGFEIPNDLRFTEKRIKIKDQFLQEGLQYIDQRSANEGFLYLLFYLTLFISDDTPKFFAIDNIDNAMNPKLGRELIKTLAKLSKKDKDGHDKHVILTTHNPAILDGLNLNDPEQRLFVIYRNAYGHTKATRIFKTETPEGQRPLPLSEQFLRGYLGGLPDNF